MKVVLFAVAFLSTCYLSAQSFRWDNEPSHQVEKATSIVAVETGIAMIYPDYYEGSPTALGEVFDQDALTGAHKKLPLGTVVQLTRLDNNLSVQVRINDRGAYCDGCIIDISKAAAKELAMMGEPQVEVRLRVLGAHQKANPEMASISTIEEPSRWAARGLGGTPQHQARPPAPNAYNSTATTQPRTPESDNEAQEVPVAMEELDKPDCTTVEDSFSAGPPLGKTENGITIIDLPFSPFSVQFGAYAKRSNAERHVRRLLDASFDNVFILREEQAEGATLHRVIAAPFASYQEARTYAVQVQELHEMRALVFQTKLIEVRD